MERIKHHYCWIKAVVAPRASTLHSELSIRGATQSDWATQLANDTSAHLAAVLPAHGPVDPPALPNLSNFAATHDLPNHGNVPPPAPSPFASAMSALHEVPDHGNVPPPAPQVFAAALSASLNVPNHGNVPPPAPQQVTDALDAARRGMSFPQPVPNDFPNHGNVPPPSPPSFAGASFMGAWQFDAAATMPLAGEQDSLILVHRPFLGSRAEAIAWRFSAEGQQWCQGARALTLMSFVAIGDF